MRERRERERSLMSEEDFIDVICDTIASSTHTLFDVAREYDIRYYELYKWIHFDPDRMAKYAQAIESRLSCLQDRVLRALVAIAEFDVRELYDDKGNIKNVKDMPERVAKIITSVKMDYVPTGENRNRLETKISGVKLADRMRGIENIGRITKMFTDKVEVDAKGPLTVRVVRFGDEGSGDAGNKSTE